MDIEGRGKLKLAGDTMVVMVGTGEDIMVDIEAMVDTEDMDIMDKCVLNHCQFGNILVK